MLRVLTVLALLLPTQADRVNVEVTDACSTDVVLPNFSGSTVAAVQAWVLNAGLGGLLVASGDEQPHVPSQSELTLTVSRNAPGSPPGSSKALGEWVGVEIP